MSSDQTTDQLAAELTRFGAPAGQIFSLEGATTPDHVRYLDLVRDPAQPAAAVVEFQRRPLLYAITAASLANRSLPSLRRELALRGDIDFLGIVEPGRLTVYGVSLEPDLLQPGQLQKVGVTEAAAPTTIPLLALQPPSVHHEEIRNLLFRLLDQTTDALAALGIEANDALSLAGRALFLRFLVDRRVVNNADLQQICPSATRFEECFADANNAVATSVWLDTTFNGDLLPLPDGGSLHWFSRFGHEKSRRLFHELTSIMHRTPTAQLELDWGHINFSHVPVGLLSQVYERHALRVDPLARGASVHYTPRHIAEYMVAEAFYGLETPERARVLDPAVGAGVFLVAAFRHLYAARWRKDGNPPDTMVIREILHRQLAGFDINEAALRLAALSLYLTALELDLDPSPLTKLKFRNLRGTVLYDVRRPDERSPLRRPLPIPGSLGPAVAPEHDGQYDIVIGNPPWTAWTAKISSDEKKTEEDELFVKELVKTSTEIIRPLVANRLGKTRARKFTFLHRVPDLPFFWRATEWARPGGRIAFAMHARLLFRQSPAARRARDDLFEAVRITGVLNGAAVRQTNVWPDVDAPFCLVFANNIKPQAGDWFYYLSPELEDAMNTAGRIRIDAKSAQPVEIGSLQQQPLLLKFLFRGTPLDVPVVERILNSAGGTTIEDYWQRHDLKHSRGYEIGGVEGTQYDASELHGLPDLTVKPSRVFFIEAPKLGLPPFEHKTLLRTRDRAIYSAPLVVVDQSPRAEREAGRAALALSDIVYNRTFFGYSCVGHPQAELLGRYLLLVLNSHLPLYYGLLASSQFGVERDTLLKEDIDRLPLRPLEDLTEALRAEIIPLSTALIKEQEKPWSALDAWVAKVYGLKRWDLETLRDTLEVSSPFPAAQKRAQTPPSAAEVDYFVRRIDAELSPLVGRAGRELRVEVIRRVDNEPWVFFRVDTKTPGGRWPRKGAGTASMISGVADKLGASEIVLCEGPGSLLLATLAQYRYWTPSRARLCALTLLRERQEVLLGGMP